MRRQAATQHPPAILLGLENAISLTVLRELGEHGVPIHGVTRDADSVGAASRHCTRLHLRPSGPIAEWLPALITSTGACALFAISESDLLQLGAMPAMIGACRLLVPRAERFARVIDKLQTLDIARGIGLRVPQTWQPRVGEDFAAHIAAMRYPLVAKWANPPEVIPLLDQAGLTWEKAVYLRNAEELAALLDQFTPIGHWPLIQQYCRGVGLGQMLHMRDGRATLRFQHRRLHEWPPEGGVSTLCRAEPGDAHGAQMDLSEQLLRALDWEGPAMVEYRYDAQTGDYWLMEVNGRFWGSLPLAWHSGAYFAWESYRRAILGQDDPAPRPRDTLRARYMVPETKRLLRILFQPGRIADPFFRRRPGLDFTAYLLSFLDPRARYYVFSRSDTGPVLRDLTQMTKKMLRREKR